MPAALLTSLVLVVGGLASAAPSPVPPAPPAPAPTSAPSAPAGEPTSSVEVGSGASGAATGASADAQLAEAKRLFGQGNQMLDVGDYQRALEYFVASRRLVPSVPNTLNAGICLAKLNRFDEALELYEALLTDLQDQLTATQRQEIAPEMAKLRAEVGSLDLQANVDGWLVIDSRPRGRLPLLAPVRVLPGRHVVRVLKDGYATFESSIQVTVGQTVTVDARLAPLANAGRIRIDDPSLAGAEVYIDGASVGVAPWEGSLAPGKHLFFIRKGDDGSAPREVTVLQSQTVLAAATLAPLGPESRILVEPGTAHLLIDQVEVGAGGWQGRLPIGAHALEAREEGYHTLRKSVRVDTHGGGDTVLKLEVDAAHPRWAAGEEGRFWLEAFGGFAMASSLASGAEGRCDTTDEQGRLHECSSNPAALGLLVGARGAYEFPMKLSIELALGYLRASKTLERTVTDPGFGASYELSDELLVHGPFAALGVGYRASFAELLEFRAHLLLGAVLTLSRDRMAGFVRKNGEEDSVSVLDGGQTVLSADLLVLPELHLGIRHEGFGASIGLTAAVLTIPGPELGNGEVVPAHFSDCATPGTVTCAPGQAFAATERAYGPAVIFVPSLAFGYIF